MGVKIFVWGVLRWVMALEWGVSWQLCRSTNGVIEGQYDAIEGVNRGKPLPGLSNSVTDALHCTETETVMC